MTVPSSAFEVDGDGQRAARQRLGLRQTVRISKQLGQVVEVSRDVGVFGSKGLLVDDQPRLANST
jgi:hypothetical protein